MGALPGPRLFFRPSPCSSSGLLLLFLNKKGQQSAVRVVVKQCRVGIWPALSVFLVERLRLCATLGTFQRSGSYRWSHSKWHVQFSALLQRRCTFFYFALRCYDRLLLRLCAVCLALVATCYAPTQHHSQHLIPQGKQHSRVILCQRYESIRGQSESDEWRVCSGTIRVCMSNFCVPRGLRQHSTMFTRRWERDSHACVT